MVLGVQRYNTVCTTQQNRFKWTKMCKKNIIFMIKCRTFFAVKIWIPDIFCFLETRSWVRIHSTCSLRMLVCPDGFSNKFYPLNLLRLCPNYCILINSQLKATQLNPTEGRVIMIICCDISLAKAIPRHSLC